MPKRVDCLLTRLRSAIDQCVQNGDTVGQCAASDTAKEIRGQIREANRSDCMRAEPYVRQQLDNRWRCDY
jgi:hypothetical protein